MKKILLALASFTIYHISIAQPFVVKDTIISDPLSSLPDPEIDWLGNNFCWAGPEGIWIGRIDKATGNFIPANGKGVLVDATPSYRGMQLVANGPEWAMSKNGSVCIYPDSATQRNIRIGTAKYNGSAWVASPLPFSDGRIPFFGSYDSAYQKDGITCASYDTITMSGTGMRLRNSSDTMEITPNSMQGGRWINGRYAISLSQENTSPNEIGFFDVTTKAYTRIAVFSNPIDQAWVVPMPEMNNRYAAWCIEKKTDRDEIAVFMNFGNQWRKVDSIRIPTNRKEIFSPEPFWWNGRTYIFLVARPRAGQPASLYDQVWIVGLANDARLFREISSPVPMRRTDPEVFYTTTEPVIYYTENRPNGIKVVHKCSTGLTKYTYPKSPFREMGFTKDYFPGTNDVNGKYLGSTETMALVQHKGKIYAGMGNWMDYPWQFNETNEGSQILRKDAYNKPWLVDTSFGFRSMRSEALVSVNFTKSSSGNNLNPAVNLLICGAGDISFDRPREMNIWVRDDQNNKWIKNTGFTVTQGSTGIRSFALHTDKITGKQYLFGGMSDGDIIKAQYNPNKPGWLEIDTARELRGLGRVMAMVVCNGDLYASAGVDVVAGDTVGGLYRRIDGPSPSWQRVYTWPYLASASGGDEPNIMRGITCVPDPKGSGRNVIIGTRANPGIVEVIEPFNNHNVYLELQKRDFFASQWNQEFLRGPSLSAYNNFVPDKLEGQDIWWQSLWVEHPDNGNHPQNGSHFLVRFKDGTYQYGDIYDNTNPVPSGKRLRATRAICKSPFPEEPYTYYFGGYDAAQDTSNNTSWIYKGKLVNPPISNNGNMDGIILYPNPTRKSITIANLPDNFKGTIQLYTITGQLLKTEYRTGSIINLTIEYLSSGIFLIRLINENGGEVTRKFIKI